MLTAYLAVIRKAQYEAFRRLVGFDGPGTYDEWQYLHAKDIADSQGRGHTVIEIEVGPDEFARELATSGERANLHALENFAFKKAQREGK